MAAMLQREPGARKKARDHLCTYPLDLVITSQLIGDLFFNGGVGKREAVMDLLHTLEPHQGDDWAFAARLGFHMSELGDARRAIGILDAALQARPHAPFIAHAMAHALLESGDRAGSHRFLVDWISRYDHSGPLDGHIQWHLSLGELENGQPAAAIERYLRASAPGVSHCAPGLSLADAGGLFCRIALDGLPLDGMPRPELQDLLAKLDGASKIPFVAVHAAALAVAFGDEDSVRRFEAMVSAMATDPADAVVLVLRAFKAYLAGDAQGCVDALERDRGRAWDAIGGSNEERALIGKLYARAIAAGPIRH
jgi:hypothetical protein